MAKADINRTIDVPYEKLFQTIIRYEDYPQFVEGCTKVQVERKGTGQARVTYHVSMIQDVVYTLDHQEDPSQGIVTWKLVESNAMKINNGRWELKANGPGKTDASYSLELEFNIPVPSFILNRLVKSSLPKMLDNFEKQAGKNGG